MEHIENLSDKEFEEIKHKNEKKFLVE